MLLNRLSRLDAISGIIEEMRIPGNHPDDHLESIFPLALESSQKCCICSKVILITTVTDMAFSNQSIAQNQA